MTRGLGAIGALRGLLPAPAVEALGAATVLGAPALLVVVVAVVYWRAPVDRRSSARLVALTLGTAALTVLLKAAFGLPRPPGAGTDGGGFPSGHALGATVVWIGLAGAWDEPRRRMWLAGAAGIVAVVALSRVTLGVHYLVDVIAGVAVGALVVGTGRRIDDPGPVFGAGAVIGVGAAAVTGGARGMAAFGVTLGAAAAWLGTGDRRCPEDRPPSALAVGAGLAGVGGLGYVVDTTAPGPLVTAVAAAIVGGWIVAGPVPVRRIAGRIRGVR
jgi:membrane-associated phospholipid phosphatase